jgi:sugar/nucleoside kinase (ribokinase family)
LFCNEHEAKLWANSQDLNEAISVLHKLSPLLAITCGSKGAIISHQGQQIDIAPFPVAALDSNGAGDAFAGAFLYGISQNWPLADCGRLASKVSAQVVSQFGPRLRTEQYQDLLKQ